ncbi:MAG: hypothetical protein IT210_04150 [Armatimonadetes bacterium]|nr:hypothetical protein [Armatimonadota bacterium]
MPDWHSIDLLRPDLLFRNPNQPPPPENEQGKDDPRLQKEITLERLVYRKAPDRDEAVPYWAKSEEILQQLARESGLDMIATVHKDNVPYGPEDVRRQPIYPRQNVDKKSVWKALNILTATYYYTWERQGDWIHFRKKD